MKGYSCNFSGEEYASARLEDVDASYKDLSEVCNVIRNKDSEWAFDFLENASKGDIPVFFRRHNKRLGHRRELGGRKGRYPKKSASLVLKTLNSAIANAEVKGLSGNFLIVHANANKKNIYPRLAPKGRMSRSFLETARIELVLKALDVVPLGVDVKPPGKPPIPEKPSLVEGEKGQETPSQKEAGSEKKEGSGRFEEIKEEAAQPVMRPPSASGDAPPEHVPKGPMKKEEKKALEGESH